MLLRLTSVFVALLGAYMLLAGEISWTELLAGVPLAALGTAYACVLHRSRQRDMRFAGVPWLKVVGRPAASLLPDAVRVGRVLLAALWRRPGGAVGIVARQPFRSSGDDPEDAARRGLNTLGLSLAPNGYALELPASDAAVLLHRLADARLAPDRDWPL